MIEIRDNEKVICKHDGDTLSEADLSYVNLTEANLWRANLSKARLWGANLRRADLTEANLSKARLWRVNLTEANLTEADLYDVNLINANLTEANLTGIRNYVDSHDMFFELVKRYAPDLTEEQEHMLEWIKKYRKCWDDIKKECGDKITPIFRTLADNGYNEYLVKYMEMME